MMPLPSGLRLDSLNSIKSKTAPCLAGHEGGPKLNLNPQKDRTAALSTSRTILTQEKASVKRTLLFQGGRG
ncbi:hypothetical protein, partial [Microcoleus sp. Pol12A6]